MHKAPNTPSAAKVTIMRYQPYMGLAEAAEYLDMPKQNLYYWIQVGKFIEPDQILKMGPVWKTEQVIQFKERQYIGKVRH